MHRTLIILSLWLCACAPQEQSAPDLTGESVERPPSGDVEPLVELPPAPSPTDVSPTEETNEGPEGIASKPAETFLPPVARLIAIGDIHGDIQALRDALTVAQVIDAEDHWSGGTSVVVQVGDQLDRGEDERDILHWLETLAGEARQAGGAVYPLLGNHEAMNVELDLRYVTEGGFADFADVPWAADDPLYASYEESERGRVAAFRPGGPYAAVLASHFITVMVGDTVFVHGGLVPAHAAYGLELINSETIDWMNGDGPEPGVLSGSDSPVWSRHYSNAPDANDCLLLFETLEALDAKRMVVAHTVQSGGITDACSGKVWRVDVGLADYYGGATQVLLIEGDEVTVLP
jgi:hypothetical protein